jgi:hypothetical protein
MRARRPLRRSSAAGAGVRVVVGVLRVFTLSNRYEKAARVLSPVNHLSSLNFR